MCIIFKLWEQGPQVNTWTVRNEASCLSCNFKDKSTKAKMVCILCLMKKIGLNHQSRSHVTQKDHKKSKEEVKPFFGNDVWKKCKWIHITSSTGTKCPFSICCTLDIEKSEPKHIISDCPFLILSMQLLLQPSPPIESCYCPCSSLWAKWMGVLQRVSCKYSVQCASMPANPDVDEWENDEPMDWPGSYSMENTRNPGIAPLLVLDVYGIPMMRSIVNWIQDSELRFNTTTVVALTCVSQWM